MREAGLHDIQTLCILSPTMALRRGSGRPTVYIAVAEWTRGKSAFQWQLDMVSLNALSLITTYQ